jgi:hypothetical protein
MSRANQGRVVNREKNAYGYASYNRGNTVRKHDLDRMAVEAEKRNIVEVPNAPRKQSKRRVKMSLGYLIFLSLATIMVGYVLFGYIKLQSDITSQVEAISTMESRLNDLTMTNEEEYTRLMSTVDLEEINLIARQELGMVNPSSEQVVVISNTTDDYVTQSRVVPGE